VEPVDITGETGREDEDEGQEEYPDETEEDDGYWDAETEELPDAEPDYQTLIEPDDISE
jgi:hypothetical protein